MSFLRPPVRRKGDRFIISIDEHDRQVVAHLLDELVDLLTHPDDESSQVTLVRLFPTVYEDDPEREAEYQRLMREELVASKLAAISTVTEALNAAQRNQISLDEAGLGALMQSINSIRLVLGTLVDVESLEADEGLGDDKLDMVGADLLGIETFGIDEVPFVDDHLNQLHTDELDTDELDSDELDTESDGESDGDDEGDSAGVALDDDRAARRDSPEYELYEYLSWLLSWCVDAISGHNRRSTE